jgi:OOP family OmpA-OmpF porin
MIKIPCLILLTLAFNLSVAQNLIPNGSFEQNRGCPNALNQLDSCLFWFNPSRDAHTSPDYYNQCSLTDMTGVPVNIEGFQKAHSGNAYSGILTYIYIPNYREYIEAELSSELQSNTCYHFKMYINLSNVSRYTSNEIGIYFSDTIIHSVKDYLPLPFVPQINNTIIPDSESWALIEQNYTATGGEKFILIGNFKNDEHTKTSVANNIIKHSALVYIYIDDVSLIACEEKKQKEDEPEIGKAFILKNISFETNKSVLLPASMPELDTLVKYLILNPKTQINIAGYTDNVGNEAYNIQLSLHRAKSVADYLISHGIALSRIKYNGYGSANPVQSNETESGRGINRRVEFLIENQ